MPDSLYALALLACPLGMGAMMWIMMRGHRSQPSDDAAARADLQAQIDHLRATQHDLDRDGAARGPGR